MLHKTCRRLIISFINIVLISFMVYLIFGCASRTDISGDHKVILSSLAEDSKLTKLNNQQLLIRLANKIAKEDIATREKISILVAISSISIANYTIRSQKGEASDKIASSYISNNILSNFDTVDNMNDTIFAHEFFLTDKVGLLTANYPYKEREFAKKSLSKADKTAINQLERLRDFLVDRLSNMNEDRNLMLRKQDNAYIEDYKYIIINLNTYVESELGEYGQRDLPF